MNKRSSRVAALKSSSGSGQRPTTPGLWATANEAAITQHIPGSIRQQHATQPSASNIGRIKSLSPAEQEEPSFKFEEADYDNDDSYDEDEQYDNDDDEEEQEYQVHIKSEDIQHSNKNMYQVPHQVTPSTQLPPTVNEWPSLETHNNKKQQVDLGGWGSTTTVPWAQKASVQEKDQEQPWKPHTLEQYENTWQQKALEAPLTQVARRRPIPGKVKTMENDGWGTPKNYVAWDDLRVQGYAHDVLEQQKSNVYWEKSSNGEWRVLNPKAGPQEREAAMAHARIQPSHPDVKMTPLSAAEWPTIQKASSQLPQQRQQRQQQPSPSPPPQNNKKAFPSDVCSDDEEVIDWDEDDGVTINTLPELTPRTPPKKGKHEVTLLIWS